MFWGEKVIEVHCVFKVLFRTNMNGEILEAFVLGGDLTCDYKDKLKTFYLNDLVTLDVYILHLPPMGPG